MDSLSPSKPRASPIITRTKLRSVITRLLRKEMMGSSPLSRVERKIINDAKWRLAKCEATMANNATELLRSTGWKLDAEIRVHDDAVLVYSRTKDEGLVFLKKRGNLTNEVINLVGCSILKKALGGEGRSSSLNYMRNHGIKQRIFTNGWTPDHSHHVRDEFKGLVELEDTGNVSVSAVMRMTRPSASSVVTGEKHITAGGLFPATTAGTPVKLNNKRPSAFRKITPGTPTTAAKRAKTGKTCFAAASFSHAPAEM